ncbi:sulfotransferase family protein [Ideonella livida]|uniref:Sulfotransferase n=1 Tax=Ideonella livida TaxID=2707176 RepID=A0A7C9PK16_9BURK|nr:sulfotransferase [Ideonella livida]NDY92934.1 sulfotransferase [Ideonella livida]
MTTTPPAAEGFLPPFFILGCVRSGTTMLRNILRQHPLLACPEETHFYRPGEPFGTPGFQAFCNSNTLKRHRQIDGVPEEAFAQMLAGSRSRAELVHRYMAAFVAMSKPGARCWFDKTPQNIYGAAQLAADFPQARFVHIVRNPLDVAASLRIGKVMKIAQLVGACSYWNESVTLMQQLKQLAPGRVLELHYERFTAQPRAGVQALMAHLGLPFRAEDFPALDTAPVSHEEEGVLSAEEVAFIKALCLPGRRLYGYAASGEPETLPALPVDTAPGEVAPVKAPAAAKPAARPGMAAVMAKVAAKVGAPALKRAARLQELEALQREREIRREALRKERAEAKRRAQRAAATGGKPEDGAA